MDHYTLHNFSNTAIPGWNLLLVATMFTTVLICLAKKYRNMTFFLCLQAFCLSGLTLAIARESHESHLVLGALANLLIKGVLIPGLLFRSLRKARLERKKEEHFSEIQAGVWVGAIVMLAAFISPPLLDYSPMISGRTLQCGIAGVFLGLWMMVFRNYLYSQVIGLLLMENSLYLTALTLTSGMPLIVELGIMFDLFVAIVVIGVLLERVRRHFATMEIEQLKQLRG